MKNILNTYKKASERAVNPQKSEKICNRNVTSIDHNTIANILKVC